MKALAIGLMMWMQANCNVPGVLPEHNFCNLNLDQSVPKIVVLPQKALIEKFKSHRGHIPGTSNSAMKGFYVKQGRDRFTIYMLDQDYSSILPQTDLLHELAHYIQDKNGEMGKCPAYYEIPAYSIQLHYYREKTGQGATADMIDIYKRLWCNTLY